MNNYILSEKENSHYEVSIVVLSYNPNFDKFVKTIMSIIKQKDITFEIIICDDGSKNSYEEEIDLLFNKIGFFNYIFIKNIKNMGTVANFLSGVEKSNGKYLKAICPGDYLYDEYTLRNWINYLIDKKAKWSFSEPILYCNYQGKEEAFSGLNHPICINPYIKGNKLRCVWNYIVLVDNAVGATMIGEKDIILQYCKKIYNEGIIYTEDSIYSLMMFDGIVGVYYPAPTIFYESGSGISTSHNSEWQKKLDADWERTKTIIRNSENNTKNQLIILKWMDKKDVISKVLTRGRITKWLRKNLFIRKTKFPENAQSKLENIDNTR